MSDDHTTQTSTSLRAALRRVVFSRRSRAVLAGGVVLGLGVTGTLAAYSDSEWASGSFTAPAVAASETLRLEGSKDGSSYSRDVTLQSTLDMTKMTVGTTYYAPLYLRTSADTTVDADIAVAAPTVTGASELAKKVSVMLTHATNATCDADTEGTKVGGGDTLGDSQTNETVRINAGAADEASAPAVLCFAFTLIAFPPAHITRTATATWTVTAIKAS